MTLSVEGYRIGELLYEDALLRRFEAHGPDEQGRERPVRLTAVPCTEEATAAAFERDVEAAKALGERGAASVLGGGRADGHVYVVQPSGPARTLADVMADGPLSPEVGMRIGAAVARELAAAHGMSPPLVHHSLRPGAILLGPGGEAHVDDFAIGRAGARGTVIRTNALAITCHYLAPEQVNPRGTPEPRSDLFALASILYEAITGQPAFEDASPIATTVKVAMAKPPPLDALPPELATVLRRLWSREPDRRGDAARAAEELEAIAGEPEPAPSEATHPPVVDEPPPPPPARPAPAPVATFDAFADLEPEKTDISIQLPNHVPTNVDLALPDVPAGVFEDVDEEPTSLDAMRAASPAPVPPLVSPPPAREPSPARELGDLSVPHTVVMKDPTARDGSDWSDSTAPLVQAPSAPLPTEATRIEPAPEARATVEPPRDFAPQPFAPLPPMAPAAPARKHIGPVDDLPTADPPPKGVPPALLWIGLGTAAIGVVVLTALLAIWLVS